MSEYAMTAGFSEFTSPVRWKGDRRSPARWILSYISHQWHLAFIMLFGAFSNAALAAAVPVLIGQAFNVILKTPPDTSTLLRIAIWIGATQVVRGALQFARNFSAELIGQRIERDIRHELYVSLLGKSMTFHSLQPVGDTMARATNDVREVNLLLQPGRQPGGRLGPVHGDADRSGAALPPGPGAGPCPVRDRLFPGAVAVPARAVPDHRRSARGFRADEHAPGRSHRRDRDGQRHGAGEAGSGALQRERQPLPRWHSSGRGTWRRASCRCCCWALAEAGSLLHSLLLFQHGLLDIGQVVAYFGLIQLFGFPTFTSLFAYSQISLGIAGARRILELINRRERPGPEHALDTAVRCAARSNSAMCASSIDGAEPALDEIIIFSQTRPDGGDRRADRLRQDHPGQAGQPHLRCDRRAGAGGRHRCARLEPGSAAQAISRSSSRTSSCSRAPSPRISPSATPLRLQDRITDGCQGRPGARLHRVLRGGLPDRDRRARRDLVRRAAPAHRAGARLPDRPAHPDPGRFDQRHRQRHRRPASSAPSAPPRSGRTTFIITHRLSQIRWADLILVMRKGKLIARGTHEELMKTSEGYRRIFSE